jgi:hypothetical protein
MTTARARASRVTSTWRTTEARTLCISCRYRARVERSVAGGQPHTSSSVKERPSAQFMSQSSSRHAVLVCSFGLDPDMLPLLGYHAAHTVSRGACVMNRQQRDVRERHWIFVTSPGGSRQSLAIPTAIYPRFPERQVRVYAITSQEHSPFQVGGAKGISQLSSSLAVILASPARPLRPNPTSRQP